MIASDAGGWTAARGGCHIDGGSAGGETEEGGEGRASVAPLAQGSASGTQPCGTS